MTKRRRNKKTDTTYNRQRDRRQIPSDMNLPDTYDHAGLIRLGYKLKRPLATLYALSPQNDPFHIGPTQAAEAEWFAKLWRKFIGDRTGVHLRRLHYLLISQKTPIQMPSGMPYRNSTDCWQTLIVTSKDARYLHLVPIAAFVDRRNAEAIVNGRDTGTPTIESNGGDSLTMLKRMPDLPKLELDVREATQRYQVEIWAEKTTMNDILKPLAERYGIHIVTGAGELSITACHLFIERAKADRVRHQIPKTVNQEAEGLAREMAREMGVPLITVEEEGTSGRPIRILYISDFDPSGQSMPVAVARKIEFLIRDQGLDLDVQVRPVVLTKKQCEEYQLPRTPIKETDVRRGAFEERHGEGATELDALEALHPGEMARILEREIARYWDDALEQETEDAAKPVQAELKRANAKVHKQHAKKIKSLRREYAKLMAARARWAKRAKPVWHAIKKGLNAEAPDLDEVEWPESDEGDEDLDPLFSSKRGYVEQIDRYKKFQIKTTAFAPRVQGKRYTKGKKVKRGKSKS